MHALRLRRSAFPRPRRRGGGRFSGVDESPGAFGNPRLAGACAWIECDINAVSDGGDHLVVLGDVRALDADDARAPLLFHRGSYRKVL
ncbi:flavin reductase family protein [Amycolatopsis sp. NPDC005232]|uniref:flavin reductase family protein n=1 Tax=Amycolatopsis sp. NPDC005232 TaxID=3157027 RepID=UPI0033AD34F1